MFTLFAKPCIQSSEWFDDV